MSQIIVTQENIVEILLKPKEFAACPSLRRMCTEAFILSMTRNHSGLQRLAAEAYGSLSDAVVSEIKAVTGIEIQKAQRRYHRAMEVRRRSSDTVGLQIDVGHGMNAFASVCLWRNEQEVRALFFN